MTASLANPAPEIPAPAPVRTITKSDLDAALRDGLRDFQAKRGDILFIGLFYPLLGILAAVASAGVASLQTLFPLLAGISLLGPLVSAGFYELARRREAGENDSWKHFLSIRHAANFNELLFMGAILLGIFAAWMISALIIHNALFGADLPQDVGGFLTMVLTTPKGWTMILLGNAVGFGFAVLVLATSFVSMPMLVDRNVGFGRAVRTSVIAFRTNRTVSLQWGLRVAILLVLGSIPLFLGLAVVLPVLGYATFHLYTRIVDRSALPPAIRMA